MKKVRAPQDGFQFIDLEQEADLFFKTFRSRLSVDFHWFYLTTSARISVRRKITWTAEVRTSGVKCRGTFCISTAPPFSGGGRLRIDCTKSAYSRARDRSFSRRPALAARSRV